MQSKNGNAFRFVQNNPIFSNVDSSHYFYSLKTHQSAPPVVEYLCIRKEFRVIKNQKKKKSNFIL